MIRLVLYILFFLSGAASLVYEIIWTRQFVPVFGNSSYAITVVLAAFMAGLGFGAWWFGRFADRRQYRLLIYAFIETGIAICAFFIPLLLLLLKKIMPLFFSSSAESLVLISSIRFVFSFLLLFIPSVLIGGTLPILTRFCVDELKFMGHRVSLLYGLNTLGAALGVFAAGFFLIETLGLSKVNHAVIALNLFLALVLFCLWFFYEKKMEPSSSEQETAAPVEQPVSGTIRPYLLGLAFLTGCVSLSLEILWVRFMSFRIASTPYSFTSILGVFLACLGLGSLLYRLFFARRKNQMLFLSLNLFLIGPSLLILITVASKYAIVHGLRFFPFISITPASPLWDKLQALNMATMVIFIPAVLLGMAFPAICTIFTQNLKTVGASVGKVYAINTLGSITGSLLPVFVIIPLIGIRVGLILMALLISISGLGLYYFANKGPKRKPVIQVAAALLVIAVLFPFLLPKNLNKDLFLSTLGLGKHNDIIFYHEGKTATPVLVQDKVSGLKDLYINSVEEVPTTYASQECFKLMGILGVLLHPQPTDVLMICFGGGIAAGATTQHPEVDSLEVVDIEESVIRAAPLLSQENNNLLEDEKVKVVIEDGRNYLFMNQKKYPLIVSDSTHPKSADSWVLYTQEFYHAVRNALADNGVFVQWLPFHVLSVQEYQIILKTFQSVFPHASLWLTHSFDEMGRFMQFSLVVATPDAFNLDYGYLVQKMNHSAVQQDLAPWGLDTPQGILENFLCAETRIREWISDVPINTDNLPWSYYNTRYSQGEKLGLQHFLPLAESIWPYLRNTGDADATALLQQDLESRFLRKKLFLQLRFKEAFALMPQDIKALTGKSNIELSKKYLQTVTEFYPDDSRRLLFFARGFRSLLGITEGNPEESQALKDMLQKSVDADPLFNESHLELAEFLRREGDMEQAALHYREVLKLNPDSLIANIMMGMLAGEKGEFEEALRYLRRALDIDSNNIMVRNNLAIILMRQNRVEEAIVQFQAAVKLNPGDIETRNNLGAAYLQQGEFEKAESQFREILEIQPDHLRAMINLAQILTQKGDTESAIQLSQNVLRLSPEDYQTRYMLSILLLRLDRVSEAKQTLEEGLQIAPDTPPLLDLLAKLYLSNPNSTYEDRAQALRLAQRACDVTKEKDPRCLDTLASAYASLGNYITAAELAQKAYDLAITLNLEQLAEQIKTRLEYYRRLP